MLGSSMLTGMPATRPKTRDHKIRRDLSKGQQYKISLADARMRNRQARFVDRLVRIDQQVKVEDARSPASLVTLPALPILDILQSARRS